MLAWVFTISGSFKKFDSTSDINLHGQKSSPWPICCHPFPQRTGLKIASVPENRPNLADIPNMVKLFEKKKKGTLLRLISLFFVIMVLIAFYLFGYWVAELSWQLISASLVVSVGFKMCTSCPALFHCFLTAVIFYLHGTWSSCWVFVQFSFLRYVI